LKVAVLGVGLIGGSIGLAARARAGARVCGWDPDAEACARALALGALDTCAADIAGAVAGADVVFVATPVGALAQTVRAALESAGAQTIVTDVGSTKRELLEAITDARFLGGHPLAGSELSGVAHAREDLFAGATWYLSAPPPVAGSRSPAPGRSTLPAGAVSASCAAAAREAPYERLQPLIQSFGARPVAIDPDAHDRLMASVSELPHILANLLVAQAAASPGDPPRDFAAGPSFRDATRVAGSNTAIWTDIYLSNRDALLAAIDELTARLAQVRAMLAAEDGQQLAAWNERARAEREALLGSHAPSSSRNV
jgi:prephenate dehydrogenase